MKFGFLSTFDNPLLLPYISAAIKNSIQDIVIIIDLKEISTKDKKIWETRTGEYFQKYLVEIVFNSMNSWPVIPFYFVLNHNDQNCQRLIKSLKIDCLFNAGSPRKLSNNLLNIVKHGIINIHPGLLPFFRGCSAVEWAIFHDCQLGNSAHFMSEDYDAGPIIEIDKYFFNKDSNYQQIRSQVYQNGCELAGKVMARIEKTLLTPSYAIAQNERESKYWDPIPEAEMNEVLSKIEKKQYKYQCL